MSVTIEYDRRAANTEAFAILAEAWNEMVQEGITPDGVGAPPYSPDAEVLYAVSGDGDIVGVLAWENHVHNDCYDVKIAYVEPSSREQGVFAEMFTALKERAYSRGVSRITANVPASSTAAIEAFDRLGSTRIAVIYEQKIK